MTDIFRKITINDSFIDVADIMASLCDIYAPPEQKAYVMGAVMTKGIKAQFLSHAAQYLLENAVCLDLKNPLTIDVCGTGGDGGRTFNVSTAVAFVLAAGAVPVAKHGNKAMSSGSGSSDVLAALGVAISTDAASAGACFSQHNLCFMQAQNFHPILKNIAMVRRALAVPTFFNFLGPLLNPAKARRQIIGVYDAGMTEKMAMAAKLMGKTDVMVVHSSDGLDEISTRAVTHGHYLSGGNITSITIDPKDFGITNFQDIKGASPEYNAAIIEDIFTGTANSEAASLVCINSAAAFVIAGVEKNMQDGYARATDIIKSGLARKKLNDMRQI